MIRNMREGTNSSALAGPSREILRAAVRVCVRVYVCVCACVCACVCVCVCVNFAAEVWCSD